MSTLRRGEKKVDFNKLWDGEISKALCFNERFDDEFALFGENFFGAHHQSTFKLAYFSEKKEEQKNVNEHKRYGTKRTGVPLLSFFISSSLILALKV